MIKKSQGKRLYGFGNSNRCFVRSPIKVAGDITRNRFIFEQLMNEYD